MRAALHPLSKRKNGKAPMIQPSVTAGLPYRRATALEKALSDGMMPFYPSAGGGALCKPGYSPFGGKGLFEAEAYLEACAVLPQGRILSHDQAEGDLLGCIKCPEAEAAETVPGNCGGISVAAQQMDKGRLAEFAVSCGQTGILGFLQALYGA